jgi:hypothetical protein
VGFGGAFETLILAETPESPRHRVLKLFTCFEVSVVGVGSSPKACGHAVKKADQNWLGLVEKYGK